MTHGKKHMHIIQHTDGTFSTESHEHEKDEFGGCGKGCTSETHKNVHELARHVKKHFGSGSGDLAGAEKETKGTGKGLHELNNKFNAIVKGSSKSKNAKAEED